jgi:hypothetical protein
LTSFNFLASIDKQTKAEIGFVPSINDPGMLGSLGPLKSLHLDTNEKPNLSVALGQFLRANSAEGTLIESLLK